MKPCAVPNFHGPRAALMGALALVGLATTTTSHAASCVSQSPAFVTPLVELYTSEGCDSCPPADRWLSKLRTDPGVVALAFHVDYWDRLGWIDRFASPAYTQRQAQQQATNGARFSYTPQLVIDGVDTPKWYAAAQPQSSRDRRPANVDISLARDGRQFSATVRAKAGAPARLAAYWAVTEHGHSTAVKAGENKGATLQHDHVVRQYLPVAAWNATVGEGAVLRYEPDLSGATAQATDVNFVVIDALNGRPVQSLKLGC